MARFDAVKDKLAAKGAADPDTLAAYIGKRKIGHAGFKALAAEGKAKKRVTKDPNGDDDKRSLVDMLGARGFDCRAYHIEDCTVRSDGDGRTVEAYAAAFNTPAEIRDQDGHYNEIVSPGSFDKTIAENGTRVGVFYNHARSIYGTPDGALSVPIGVPIEAPRADQHGVMTVTRYLDNPLADSVLDAIKQRAITAQSFSGRFIKSTRTRAVDRGKLPTIARSEVALREYGPTPFPAYQQAHVVGTRSAQAFMTEIFEMDADERAQVFAEMVALATPLAARATPEPARESITVSVSTGPATTPEVHVEATQIPAEPADTTAPPVVTTPETEPARADVVTSPEADDTAEEPPTHSARQADLARRIRVAQITRGMR